MISPVSQQQAASTIPLVDITQLRDADGAGKAEVAQAIRAACLDKGFFYCSGHGVDPALIAEVFAQSAAFFDRPLADKLTLNKTRSIANRGYEPMGDQTLEAGAPPDRKEGYYIGCETAQDDPRTGVEFNAGPNVWPKGAPAFRKVMERYHAALVDLAADLFRGLALSLDLPEDNFDTFRAQPTATLRLLHYPPQRANPHPDEKGCGAHTDFGGITILLQDDVGGLEVWDHDAGLWIPAPPIDGAFVVNLGDMIARWTNDRYRSTVHRVINRTGRERYSAPFFFSGRPSHRVECLPNCLDDGVAHYPPTTVEDHMRERYAQTYGLAKLAD